MLFNSVELIRNTGLNIHTIHNLHVYIAISAIFAGQLLQFTKLLQFILMVILGQHPAGQEPIGFPIPLLEFPSLDPTFLACSNEIIYLPYPCLPRIRQSV